MLIDTTHRSSAPEIMDDFDMKGDILKDALDKIASINQLLGGNSITLQGVQTLLKGQSKSSPIHIIDIGCGNGDMLRALASYAARNELHFILQGIDANEFTIGHARNLSANYPNISYACRDIFDQSTPLEACDIILCTLTLHHFTDQEIVGLSERFIKAARLGFVVNDLQRSMVPYYLFHALCFVFRLNYMSRQDGLVSILRGFKKEDLLSYSRALKIKNYFITWKWAFRYQWIVKST
jgi:2-polyprenyl-3-methyl-5-hydroxy-6-metoxy-1,4-benzoquinol methylase